MSVNCSFDGGPGEACSFPLEVGIDRFGTDILTLMVTVADVYGQSRNSSIELIPCELCSITRLFFEMDTRRGAITKHHAGKVYTTFFHLWTPPGSEKAKHYLLPIIMRGLHVNGCDELVYRV